jgi:hypothetical protein
VAGEVAADAAEPHRTQVTALLSAGHATGVRVVLADAPSICRCGLTALIPRRGSRRGRVSMVPRVGTAATTATRSETEGASMTEPDPRPGEEDVERDDAQALSRATGGGPSEEPDAAATTGTGDSGEFVGRVAGQDVGYAGETGAERRAAEQQ